MSASAGEQPVIDGIGPSAATQSTAEFLQAIDRSHDAARSVVLRYRRALRLEAAERDDQQIKQLLERTSIREGLRIVPLFTYHGVEVDILDATSLMRTGTHKSIDGCVTTAQCLLRGFERIVFESGGNTGTALTVYDGRLGVETFFFAPTENIGLLDSRAFDRPTAHVIAVDDPRQVKPSAAAFAQHNGLPRVPQLEWRYQASAFIGCFVLEHLLEHTGYHYLVQSISAAFAPIGIYRVLQAHRERLGTLPTFLGIQQEANCPMVRAWRARSASIVTETVDSTTKLLTRVMNDGAPHTYGTLDELRTILTETGGDLTTVNHQDFREHLSLTPAGKGVLDHLQDKGVRIALRDGEVIEKAGVMALAGTLREIRAGRIADGSRVLVCLTGGTAEPDGRVRAMHRLTGHADAAALPAASDFAELSRE
jgi:threonine synthase